MHELNEFKCRICEIQHASVAELAAHLSQTHAHGEMPYACDACGFRTSFYADAIYHIKKEHTGTLRHFCPYCLKSIVLPYDDELGLVHANIFYSHLTTHFDKRDDQHDTIVPSKCTHCLKCILHIRYMKDHLTYDHSGLAKRQRKSLGATAAADKPTNSNQPPQATTTTTPTAAMRTSKRRKSSSNGKNDDSCAATATAGAGGDEDAGDVYSFDDEARQPANATGY